MQTLNTNLSATRATTQFINYNFNSYANFNGAQLGVKDDGLFRLSGDLDNTDNIDAEVEFATTDFGDSHKKHMRSVLLGYESEGSIKVEATESGSTDAFITKNLPGLGMGRPVLAKLPGQKNITGRYWSFKVLNVSGSDFQLDSIAVTFIKRSHNFA